VIWWNCLDKFDKYNKLNKYFKFIIILSKSSEKDWMNPKKTYRILEDVRCKNAKKQRIGKWFRQEKYLPV